MIYHFLLERMKIENVEMGIANFHDKTEYVIQIRNLKQALNQVLKKFHREIKFNQNAWLKNQKKNMRKHRDFKFFTTERRRNFSQKIY